MSMKIARLCVVCWIMEMGELRSQDDLTGSSLVNIVRDFNSKSTPSYSKTYGVLTSILAVHCP